MQSDGGRVGKDLCLSTLAPSVPNTIVHLVGCQIAQRLMEPLGVVEDEVLLDALPGLSDGLVVLGIHVFVLQGSPEPFGEDVVHAPASSVHADENGGIQQHLREVAARKLRPLVGVEDLRGAQRQGALQRPDAEVGLEAGREFPGEHVARVPVHHCAR